MLEDFIKKGVILSGLSSIINSGKPYSQGSFSLEYTGCLFQSVKKIVFANNALLDNQIVFLPYQPERNAEAPMGGIEVISGQFTGCIMGVYLENGNLTVNHVDTAEYEGARPHKVEWEAKKGVLGDALKNECVTKGVISDYLSRKGVKVEKLIGAGVSVLCIASPVAPHNIMQVIVFKNAHNDYEVKKIL